jgi:hypothetical protein
MIFGIVFLIIGVGGFIPAMVSPHTHPDVTVTSGLGLELGLFPINLLHNIVHVLFGIWGLMAARSIDGAKLYARSVAIIYALLTVMGLIPALRLHTTFGLVPLYGNDIWLHALLAIVAGYFGFVHRDQKTAARA